MRQTPGSSYGLKPSDYADKTTKHPARNKPDISLVGITQTSA